MIEEAKTQALTEPAARLESRPPASTSPASLGLRVLARIPDVSLAVDPAREVVPAPAKAASPEILEQADQQVLAGLELAARWLAAVKQSAWVARLPALAMLAGVSPIWSLLLQTISVLAGTYRRLSQGEWTLARQPRFLVACGVLVLLAGWALVMSRPPGVLQVADAPSPAPAAHAPQLAAEPAARETSAPPFTESAPAAPPSYPIGPQVPQVALNPNSSPASVDERGSAAEVALAAPSPPAAPSANGPADLAPVPASPVWGGPLDAEREGTYSANRPAATGAPSLADPTEPVAPGTGPALGPALGSPPASDQSPFQPSRWSEVPRSPRVAARVTGVRASRGYRGSDGAAPEGIRQMPLAPTTRMR